MKRTSPSSRSKQTISYQMSTGWYERVNRLAQIKGLSIEEYTREAVRCAVGSDEELFGGLAEYRQSYTPPPSPFDC